MTPLKIANNTFTSRLFTGTGKFSSNDKMEEAILASGSQLVTVAMKRIHAEDKNDDMLKHIIHPHIQLLPNTNYPGKLSVLTGLNWRFIRIPAIYCPIRWKHLKPRKNWLKWDS